MRLNTARRPKTVPKAKTGRMIFAANADFCASDNMVLESVSGNQRESTSIEVLLFRKGSKDTDSKGQK